MGVAREAGEVVAGVLALRQDVVLEGEPARFLHVVDVFNDFERGVGLRRARAYLDLCEAFRRRLGGQAPEEHPVFHGIPNRRAHRLGFARLGYEILRSENVLVADVTTHDPEPGSGIDVEEVSEFPDEIAGVFEAYRGRKGALGVRDAAWLNWRFVRHPERDYRIALARRAGELLGYAVLRRGVYAGHGGGILADWLVPMEVPHLAWELLAWAGEVSRGEGAERLLCSVPDKGPEWAAFQAMGFKAWGTDEYVVIRSFQKPYVMSWLFANWYYTLADSERG
jgi:hypothetical protein